MTVDGKVQLSMVLRTFAAQDPGSWAHVIRQAETFDRAGVDRLAVSDHVVFGEDLDAYGRPEIGGQAGGTQPTGPDGHWLEPITLLSLLAGRTSRIRLATNVLIAALRRPVVLAKTAATLDVLSGGRLDLGVGVGWQREEYEAALRGDPVPRFRGKLVQDGTLPSAKADELSKKVADEMQAAVTFALNSPFPKNESALDFNFA